MTDDTGLHRRTYLKGTATTGALGAMGLAGCLDLTGDDGGGDELEIVHWWTAGGEEEALQALIDGFLEEYDDYDENDIDNNAAPGGAGSGIDTEIQSRITSDDPPSTFQIWPGESLTLYTDDDVLEDIGDLWDDDMQENYLDDIQDMCQPDGEYVSVPINIHRLNNVFYNVEVLDDAGIDPDAIDSADAFLTALEAADDAGYIGLAQQTQEVWTTLQSWETVFVSQHGVDAYTSFLDGDVEGAQDQILESLEYVDEAWAYINPDASSIGWDEANGELIDGNAAFAHQGDWAAGGYNAADMEYGEEWDYIVFPGTEGVYQSVMDSFVKPTNNPSDSITDDWLTYCGSTHAHEQFNPVKGSIPPRTDVATDDFPPFLQDQMEDFQNSDTQPPTIAHGSGLDPDSATAMEEAFAEFIENRDPQETTDRVVNDLS